MSFRDKVLTWLLNAGRSTKAKISSPAPKKPAPYYASLEVYCPDCGRIVWLCAPIDMRSWPLRRRLPISISPSCTCKAASGQARLMTACVTPLPAWRRITPPVPGLRSSES
jgi:hypothetical protein